MHKKWPISKYVGKFPKGRWEFIEEFKGTEKAAWKRITELAKKDRKCQYRFWNNRM